MRRTPVVQVVCDWCERDVEQVELLAPGAPTVWGTQAVYFDPLTVPDGWERVGSHDVCPSCAEEGRHHETLDDLERERVVIRG